MRDLINGLLAFSRVGTQGKELEDVESAEAMEDALQNLSIAIEESGAHVSVEGELPTVQADRGQLMQLFQNLVSNAIKFCQEKPVVRISASAKGRWVEFSVADNGIGIDPEHAERIFQIFQRLHSRDEYEGTGIGLALCRRIVERHHGEIRVGRSPDGGADFRFTIPAAKGQADVRG
jgi:signal transduction histidine kinase